MPTFSPFEPARPSGGFDNRVQLPAHSLVRQYRPCCIATTAYITITESESSWAGWEIGPGVASQLETKVRFSLTST
jgi:hypothetical protein